MAEEEGARFSKMVDLFGEYYLAQEQRDKRIVEKVEKMTATVSQLVKEAPAKSQSSIEYYSPLLTSVTAKNLNMSRTQPFSRTIHARNRTSL